MNLTIRQKLLMGFIFLNVVILIIGIYSFVHLKKLTDAIREIYQGPLHSINYTRAMQTSFLVLQTSFNKLIYDPNADSVQLKEDIAINHNEFIENMDVVKELAKNQKEVTSLNMITHKSAEWWKKIKAITEDRRLYNGQKKAINLLNDEINDEIEWLIELEATMGYEKILMSESSAKRASMITFILIGCGFVISTTLSWLLARTIIRAFRQSLTVANHIAAGNLDNKISPTSNDEAGQLLNALLIMQNNLRDRINDLFEKQSELEIVNSNLREMIIEKQIANKKIENLNREMSEISRQAGMSEVSSSILHNVGNVLNSINTSLYYLKCNFDNSCVGKLQNAKDHLDKHTDNIDSFSADKNSPLILKYIQKISPILVQENENNKAEAQSLEKNIAHIRNIISRQQSYATRTSVVEEVNVKDVINEVVNICQLPCGDIVVEYDYNYAATLCTDRHLLMQILLNLITNAKQSLLASENQEKKLVICSKKTQGNALLLIIQDTGLGIEKENLTKIFTFGFTTKENGHGFGLHSCANTANQLNGKISADSDGPGCGASFAVELPLTKTNPWGI